MSVKKKGMSVEDVALALQFSKDSYEDLESGRTTAEEWGPKLPLIATKLQTKKTTPSTASSGNSKPLNTASQRPYSFPAERRICAEIQVNLAYRWFCKLGIEDKIPDHSVFCRARQERFRQSDALRRVFEAVVAMSIAAGLVGGEAFSIDASLIKADVNKKKRIPGDQPIAWPKAEEASHAVREYLAALDTARGDEDRGGGRV